MKGVQTELAPVTYVFSNVQTLPVAIIRSGRLSPFTSATVKNVGADPAPYIIAFRNVPSPLPSSTATAPVVTSDVLPRAVPLLAPATSMKPSPLQSPVATA